MATITSRHDPSFALFPHNNNRTAWRPFGLPVILVVPHSVDANGLPIPDGVVSDVMIAIENTPREALVAGANHIGLRVPDRTLFARLLSYEELISRQISLLPLSFLAPDGTISDIFSANDGDTFLYTTTSGVTDTLTLYRDAYYYDLSDILIETQDLPSAHYVLAYTCNFFARVLTVGVSITDLELLCIDPTDLATAALRFDLNHPGEVIDEFHRLTPGIYLTNAEKAEDTTLAMYRPLTDALQDIFDEQTLLRSFNWVFNIPFEGIPYLSQLLGWDIPYFPQSVDQLRRAVLRRTVEFQKLKGSRRAIRELMNLFGFTVLINNLWYAADGSRFISPGENLPDNYVNQKITFAEVCQVEPLLASYITNGFGDVDIPLLFRPQQLSGLTPFVATQDLANLTVDSYLVASGSPADNVLADLVVQMQADPANYGIKTGCVTDANNFQNPTGIHAALSGLDVVGYSQVLVQNGVPTDQSLVGTQPPILKGGVTFDINTNKLHLVFNSYIDFSTGLVLYSFATYTRQETIVPPILQDLQSNRFNIQILNTNTGEVIQPDVVAFVLDFIFLLKAFHSLLNVVSYEQDLVEGYAVTDQCAGGDVTQRFDTGVGQQQVPPAIIPNLPDGSCRSHTLEALGYKPTDIQYRLDALGSMLAEFLAYQALDGRSAASDARLRLSPALPVDRPTCQFTPQGQDRVTDQPVDIEKTEFSPSPNAGISSQASESNLKLSPILDVTEGQFYPTGTTADSDDDSSVYDSFTVLTNKLRKVLCDTDGKTDYCYKGRPQDDFLYLTDLLQKERNLSIPCSVGYGSGIYYTFPAPSTVAIAGVDRPAMHSLTPQIVFTGGTKVFGTLGYMADHRQSGLLGVDYKRPLPRASSSWLGRLYRGYDQPKPESLHYSNRPGLNNPDQIHNLALQRPELDINMPYQHLPGCRFPTMDKLVNDFVSSDWQAKPWDDQPDTTCCLPPDVPLNAHLVEDSAGDFMLVFDEAPFTIIGNGLEPDISTFGSVQAPPAAFTATDVIHSVYMVTAPNHPAITLDDEICVVDEPPHTLTTTHPLFPSARPEIGGSSIDFIDGYPCERGYHPAHDMDLDRSGLYFDVFTAMGLTGLDILNGETGTSGVEVLFNYGSGILVSTGIRFDCGCLLAPESGNSEGTAISAGVLEGSQLPCEASLFLDDDGNYDFDSDKLSVIPYLTEEEEIGASSVRFDGSIPSFFETIG